MSMSVTRPPLTPADGGGTGGCGVSAIAGSTLHADREAAARAHHARRGARALRGEAADRLGEGRVARRLALQLVARDPHDRAVDLLHLGPPAELEVLQHARAVAGSSIENGLYAVEPGLGPDVDLQVAGDREGLVA